MITGGLAMKTEQKQNDSRLPELDNLGRLAGEAERQVLLPGGRRKALLLLAALGMRIEKMKRAELECEIVDRLWPYLDFCEGEDIGEVVRDLLVRIGTRRED
jgi:hypothetical protein